MTDDCQSDIEAVPARRHHSGGDYRATLDGRIYVGSPYIPDMETER